jgi:AcrR family transcriptional regulator
MTESRPADGRERLLQAAIRHLETRGEAELRITEIAREAGVAIGLIRHHYGSRDGLVAEAQQVRVEGMTREDLEAIRPIVENAATYAEIRAGIERIVRMPFASSRREVRRSRFAAISTAHGRPAAREHIGHTVSGLLDRLTDLLVVARDRGLTRDDFDPRATATFIQAYALGLILADLDPTPADSEELVRIILAVIDLLLAPEPRTGDLSA